MPCLKPQVLLISELFLKSFKSLENYINRLKEELTDIVSSHSHKLMESSLLNIIDQEPPTGIEVTSCHKTHHQFLKDIFTGFSWSSISCRNISECMPQIPMCIRSSTKSPKCCGSHWINFIPTFNWSRAFQEEILSGLGEVFTSIFGGSSLGSYNKGTIDKRKKHLHILDENQNLQSQQIQDEFALRNLTRVELGDWTLLHMLDITLILIQQTYNCKITYLEIFGNMISLTDINARLASIWTGITHIQVDVANIYTYLETLATHIVFSLLLAPSSLSKMFKKYQKNT